MADKFACGQGKFSSTAPIIGHVNITVILFRSLYVAAMAQRHIHCLVVALLTSHYAVGTCRSSCWVLYRFTDIRLNTTRSALRVVS